MRFAYADPPYLGQAFRRYREDPRCAEVDPRQLIDQLVSEYPDGWALSLSSSSLREILPLAPPKVRVLAWVKPFCCWKPYIHPAYAWEPVLLAGGRPGRWPAQPTVRDWLAEPMTMRKGLCGVKPREFCYWLFDALNLQAGDVLDDLFPGSGAVSEALREYLNRSTILGKPDTLFAEETA